MRSDIWLGGVLLTACMTLATAAPALAQKSADTLRITWRDAIPDVDPYYNSQRTGMVVAFHAFDCLVYRDPVTMEMKPALATSWKQVDATTIDFTLRCGRAVSFSPIANPSPAEAMAVTERIWLRVALQWQALGGKMPPRSQLSKPLARQPVAAA